jgi:predicted NBD/HSP70 family sugar kinase
VIAVDLDVRGLTLAAVGIGGTVLSRQQVAAAEPHPDDVTAAVVAAIPALRKQGARGPLVGIGVSVPGTVDRHQTTIGVAPNLGWRSVPLGTLLGDALRRRVVVRIGNDADLSALAEHTRGGGRGCDDLVFLMGRAGVGAGLFVNGVPVRGHAGHAGEIGHTVVDPSGPECHCGKRGCLETYVSDSALLTLAGRPGAPTREAVGKVLAAAREGSPTERAAVRSVATSLGRAVAGLANILDPERVILGGTFGEIYAIAANEVHAGLAGGVLDAPGQLVELAPPLLGEDSALLGAAEVGFSALLRDPSVLRYHPPR